jgi:hypothetical protein
MLKFVGQVNQGFDNNVPPQLTVRSAAVPISGLLTTKLSFYPGAANDQVLKMTGTDGSYTAYTWNGGSWSPSQPTIGIAESFWTHNYYYPSELNYTLFFWP